MKPFEIFKVTNTSNIDFFREIIRESLKDYGFPINSELQELHNHVSPDDVNDARLKCFNNLNASDWFEIINIEFLDRARACLGPDLLVQKSINVSIQLPHDESSVLPIHSDCNSGDSPYQLNIWIPLTNANHTASMFIIGTDRSIDGLKEILKGNDIEVTPDGDDYLSVKYGEYVIFHPAFLHGNSINKTNQSRVSLNLRFASIPLERSSSADLSSSYGAYFKVWSESKWRRLSDLANSAIRPVGK